MWLGTIAAVTGLSYVVLRRGGRGKWRAFTGAGYLGALAFNVWFALFVAARRLDIGHDAALWTFAIVIALTAWFLWRDN